MNAEPVFGVVLVWIFLRNENKNEFVRFTSATRIHTQAISFVSFLIRLKEQLQLSFIYVSCARTTIRFIHAQFRGNGFFSICQKIRTWILRNTFGRNGKWMNERMNERRETLAVVVVVAGGVSSGGDCVGDGGGGWWWRWWCDCLLRCACVCAYSSIKWPR